MSFDSRIRCRSKLTPPAGWEEMKGPLLELNEEMRMAETESETTSDPKEKLWKVMRLNWKRSRIVFDLRYRKKTMSAALYRWIISQGYADNELIQAWRKPGYDRLCCVACMSKKSDHGGTCICRVPRSKRDPNIKCFHCGCPGCCSGDFSSSDDDDIDKFGSHSNAEEKKEEPTTVTNK